MKTAPLARDGADQVGLSFGFFGRFCFWVPGLRFLSLSISYIDFLSVATTFFSACGSSNLVFNLVLA
jgi:hypothetical protein